MQYTDFDYYNTFLHFSVCRVAHNLNRTANLKKQDRVFEKTVYARIATFQNVRIALSAKSVDHENTTLLT